MPPSHDYLDIKIHGRASTTLPRPGLDGWHAAMCAGTLGVRACRRLRVRLVMLVDRRTERSALDSLLASARGGMGSALVLRGEPGVGKTALLEYAIESASGFRTPRAVGVESEMELAFAALHQLCAPMLGRLERLPGPQSEALGVAFGLRAGEAPDRFVVGLAVLGLLSDVAREQPLLCVIDDA